MKALLIWSKFQSFSFWNFEKVCKFAGVEYMSPPLGMLTVGALLPSAWDLRLVDENVRALTEDDLNWADVVFVGSKIVSRKRACDIIRWAKKVGKPVVAGGPDVTLNEKLYADAGADYVALGEGELTIPKLVADLEAGTGGGVYRAEGSADLTKSPIPRFDLVNLKEYLYVGLQYSRGCPHNCEFCNVIDIFTRYQTKTPEQVLGELDTLYALGYRGQVDFFDDNLVGKIGQAKTLLRALAGWLKEHNYPFQFSTSLTLNIANDEELLLLLREARFKYFLIGIETPNEDVLRTAQKPQNTGYSIAEACDRIYRIAGATVHSGFLIGLDGEPKDIGEQIVRCIDETSIPWVMAGVVYPLPGKQLSRRLDCEGRLFPAAREFDHENVRDQISAGLQFRAERPADDVVTDLLDVLDHAFDPKRYFARCANVSSRVNTAPVTIPGWAIFFRNIRTVLRLMVYVSMRGSMRWPFWKAFWTVLFKNPVGIEALVTLSVLFVHFEDMLPYCIEAVETQRTAMREMGEDAWYRSNGVEPGPHHLPVVPSGDEGSGPKRAPATAPRREDGYAAAE